MYLPYLFDVAECVISRDEHEYYGDTATLVFIEKMEVPRNIVPQGPWKPYLALSSSNNLWRIEESRPVIKASEPIQHEIPQPHERYRRNV